MEADTLHSFERTAEDELTFQKGDVLKVRKYGSKCVNN